MKIIDGVTFLTIGEISAKINRGVQSIKQWYDWAEANNALDQLPETHRNLDEKGTRYFREYDLSKLVQFRDGIKYGQMSEFSCKRWGKKVISSSSLSKETLEPSFDDNNSITANTNVVAGNYDRNNKPVQIHPIEIPEDIPISCTEVQLSIANSKKKFKKQIMWFTLFNGKYDLRTVDYNNLIYSVEIFDPIDKTRLYFSPKSSIHDTMKWLLAKESLPIIWADDLRKIFGALRKQNKQNHSNQSAKHSKVDQKILYQVTEKNMAGNLESVGLAVAVELGDGWIGYHTTTRGRQRHGKFIKENKNGFSFELQDHNERYSGILEFEILTIEQFESHWRNKLTSSVPAFQTDTDLHGWYCQQYGSNGYHY